MNTAACTPSRADVPRGEWRRMGPVVVLVVAAHALMVAIPWQPVAVESSAATGAPRLQLRTIEASPPAAKQTTVSEAAGLAVAEPEHAARATRTSNPEPAAHTVPAAAAERTSPAAVSALPTIAAAVDEYMTRSQLSIAPSAIDPIMVAYPEFAGDVGRYTTELGLLIDEHGRVVQVQIEDADLPSPVQDAARTAFMSARFRPGEMAERGAVKSRIRIEVIFEHETR
jgi:hypothetical protein